MTRYRQLGDGGVRGTHSETSELPMMASTEQRPVQQKPKACSLQLDQALLANNKI